jgi:hypothetical protein
MRHIRRFAGLQRKGVALLLVMFIAFASLVLLTTLLSSLTPRRASVSGEAQADRALAVADGKIDMIMNTINTLPQVNVTGLAGENDVQAAIVAGWEGMLNGYGSDANSATNASNVSTYFYHTTTHTWYAVWNTTAPDHLMSIPATAKLGHEVGSTESTSGTVLVLVLKNLSTNGFEAGGIIGIDPICRTNNEWFEVDTNASYNLAPTDVWTITTSAYMLSQTSIVKTVEAKAEKNVSVSTIKDPSTTVIYNWFTQVNRTSYFSDYVFLDNFDVNFGRNSTTTGYIHANGTVNMGGWATYPISSTERVTDLAVDDTDWWGNPKSDGRFGPDKNLLSWAKTHTLDGHKYAQQYAARVNWLNVDAALTGASVLRKPASETGMQDKAIAPYYVDMNGNGTATITFSIESGVGKVIINGTKYDMPANNIIYVNGNATVKGSTSTGLPGVLGSCMVGVSGNINIAGDILYNTVPRTGENDPSTANPDFLGLVANGNIKFPYSTYQADKHLIIDAALVADGWVGIDTNDWSWHYLNTDPNTAPTLVVRGAMAAGDGSHLFATTSGGQIKGYDLRQYNFDWNLKQLGVMAGFPTTGFGMTSTETIVTEASMIQYGIVSNSAQYAVLVSQLTNPSAHSASSPLVINGRAYYAKATTVPGPSTWEGTGFVTAGMYRIGWKEQIGESVAPTTP